MPASPILLDSTPRLQGLDAFKAAMLAGNPAEPLPAVDARDVTDLPIAWVQVLLAAAQEARLRGGQLTILNPSFAFAFAFEALGLESEGGLFTVDYAP
jgi:anti-anti-sigma regulatory factor